MPYVQRRHCVCVVTVTKQVGIQPLPSFTLSFFCPVACHCHPASSSLPQSKNLHTHYACCKTSMFCNKQWSGLTTPFFRRRSRGSRARAVPNHSFPCIISLLPLPQSKKSHGTHTLGAERETMVSVFSPVFFSGLASGAAHGYGV